MEIFYIICAVIATWRLSFLIIEEEGPFLVFEKIRNKFNIIEGMLYEGEEYNLVGNILICHYCTSIYVAAFTFTLHFLHLDFINIIFAISGLSILINLAHNLLRGE